MIKVEYIDVPAGAKEAATATSKNAQEWASNVISGSYVPDIATFEQDGWPLDGSRDIMSDLPEDIGWWSKSMSLSDGKFVSNPEIIISLSDSFSAAGITFEFKKKCEKVKVTWYNGETVLKSGTYTPDNNTWVLSELVEGFNKIVADFVQTEKPFEFIKLSKIIIGQLIVFGPDDLISVTTASEADNSLCELTVDNMTINLHDKEKRDLLPQRGQTVNLYRNNKLLSHQFIFDYTRYQPHFYSIKCESAIGLMEDQFLGGIYDNINILDVASEIFGDIPFEISPDLQGVNISGYLPVCTRREALQQLAFASGAVVSTCGTETVKLSKLPETLTNGFDTDSIFLGGSVRTEKKYARISVAAHSYTQSGTVEYLIDDNVSGDNMLYTFSEPHYGYTISGGTITASGANWIRVSASGPFSVRGKKYIHSISIKTRINPLAVSAERKNTLSVDGATLITEKNAKEALNRLYSACMLRSTLIQDVVVSGQKCGDRVRSVSPWGSSIDGYIVSMSSNYTQQGHTASVRIRGTEVQ